MKFDVNTYIIAQGDMIAHGNGEEISVNRTNGFATNTGG